MKSLIVLSVLFGVPLIELFLFLEIADQVGAATSIAATILTATTGVILVKKQGLKALKTTKMKFHSGKLPVHEVLNGVGILGAALMLFIPGFFTDSIGLCLFIPKLRLIIMSKLLGSVTYKTDNNIINQHSSDYSDPKHGPIIDGQAKSSKKNPKQG